MKRKTGIWTAVAFLAAAVATSLVVRQQFYGSAVRAERDLYISARTDYAGLTDSILPAIRHRRAFRFYAERLGLPATFKSGHYVLR